MDHTVVANSIFRIGQMNSNSTLSLLCLNI